MALGIGINTAKPDVGAVPGEQVPIACGVWFTSTGRILPKTIRYRDQDGMLCTISDFLILSQEETRFCGILSIQYECAFTDGPRRQHFRLLYYLERKEWKLWFKYTE